ncbi:hypothetical protein TSOC_015454, partial [Tetrabaena socialis]
MAAAASPLDSMTAGIAELFNAVAALSDSFAAKFETVIKSIDNLKTSVDELKGDVDELKGDVDELKGGMKQLMAKTSNSMLGSNDDLVVVPRSDGQLPDLAYPKTISTLVVAGNELTPGKATTSGWNKAKSKALLAFYEGQASASEASGDEEKSEASSRRRRLRLC